jgi:hypothetical protein
VGSGAAPVDVAAADARQPQLSLLAQPKWHARDALDAARLHIIDLLDRRMGALGIRRRLHRGDVDASIVLHWLDKPLCTTAMKSANAYVRAARIQMERIDPAARAWYDGSDRSQVFHEIHYYFICWDAVWKRLKVIKNRSGFHSLKPIVKKHRVEAELYAFGRDQLEHYDEWLAGYPRYAPEAAWDHGNLQGTTYTLAGRRWDVSRASLERLECIVRDFEDAIMTEGSAMLMARQMNPDATPR